MITLLFKKWAKKATGKSYYFESEGPRSKQVTEGPEWLRYATAFTVLQLVRRSPFQFPMSLCVGIRILEKDSFFKFSWFLLFFVLGLGGSLQIYDVTNTTCNSRNIAQHNYAVDLHYIGLFWNVLRGIYGWFDLRFDSNSNPNARFVFDSNAIGQFAGPYSIGIKFPCTDLASQLLYTTYCENYLLLQFCATYVYIHTVY